MSFWTSGGRTDEREPLGVIDIGSNSVRLVIYEGATRASTPLFNEKVLCGLGRSVASTGHLGEDSMERALVALKRFRAIIRIFGVKNVHSIATAAVRDATDGPDFIARAERACGCRIEILSGLREAELAAQGVRMGFHEVDGIAGDLGGGSLELIDIDGERMKQASTLPLGGLRLIDVTGNKIDAALDVASASIAEVPWLEAGKGRPFYAVGGTWRTLARLHMAHIDYPMRVMHAYAISARSAIDFCDMLRRTKKPASLPGMDDVARPRREVLPYGALVLERVLQRLQSKDVIFSVFGVREGLLFSLLSPNERRKDPLLGFCEDYARLRSRSVENARELREWTDPLFDSPGPDETPEERRLRHAACLLSDIGWRDHPDHRGPQSLRAIAHAPMSGVDHQGRAFLALAVYYRHVGVSDPGSDEIASRLKSVVTRRALKRARIVGAAIRTAHMLSLGRPGVIDGAPLAYGPGTLILSIPQAFAALDGERLRRRFEALAGLLDCKADVRISR